MKTFAEIRRRLSLIGFLIVGLPIVGHAAGNVIAWGYNANGQTNVPPNLTNVVRVAAGDSSSIALQADGTVIGWGQTTPPPVTDAVAIAGGYHYGMALRRDGTIISWGDNSFGQITGGDAVTGSIDIAAGWHHGLARKSDGTLVSWGDSRFGQSIVPDGLSDVRAVAGGGYHSIALRSDGTVVAWGLNDAGQANVPLGLTGVVAIAAGGRHNLALLSNGRIAAWGSMPQSSVPDDLEDVIAIAAGGNGSLALKADGTVIGWGDQAVIPSRAKGLSAIAAGWDHAVGIQLAPLISVQPFSRSVAVGDPVALQVEALSSSPIRYQWRNDGVLLPGATNASLAFASVQLADAGQYDVIVSNDVETNTSAVAVLQVVPPGAPSIRLNGRFVVDSFSVPSPERITVSISGGFTDGFIFYTLDGTEPNLGSAYYTGPFTLTNSATVVAMSLNADLVQVSVAPPVKALIVPTYSLTRSTLGNGTIAANPLRLSYLSNSVVTLTATPGQHYAFDHWTGDLTGNANPATLTMNGPRRVQAVFVPRELPLVLTGSPGGTVAANGQSLTQEAWFPVGSTVTLAASPDPGWGFLRWQGTSTSTSNPLLLVMNQAHAVQGIFGTTFLTLDTPGGGRVSADGQTIAADTQYPPGRVVALAAIPEGGWSFLRWEGSISSTNNPLLLTMNQSSEVQAVFGTVIRTVVAGSGSIGLNPTNPVPYGTTVTATALPSANYSFLAWSGAASGNVNPTSLTATNPSPLVGAVFTGPPVPVVVTHPTNLTVVQGSPARFAVTVSGAVPVRFQWRKETHAIANATNANYTIPSAVPTDSGNYDVVASNSFGSTTSTVAVLTVAIPPSITAAPGNQILPDGGVAVLTVEAGGTAPLTYQWHNEIGLITGATNATYVLNPVRTNDAGRYVVVVTNPYGEITSPVATLTVHIPVRITQSPVPQVVPFRGTALFRGEATGYPAPAYQWLFNGESLTGATGPSLMVTNVGTNVLGNYSLVAWNVYSAATSSPTMLLMSPSLRVPFQGDTVVWGKRAALAASAIGSGELTYQWFRDGVPLDWGTNATLEFSAVQLTDAGFYSLVVRSPWGSVTNTPAQLVVNPANIALAMYAGVTIDGVPGYTYGIQASTDLRDTNAWMTVTNYTLTQPVETWIDFESAGRVKRFYRVVVP